MDCSNILRGAANIFLNGSNFQYPPHQFSLGHFNLCTEWEESNSMTNRIEDVDLFEPYAFSNAEDTAYAIRMACAALIPGTLFLQPIGLALNLLNRTVKVISFSHFWVEKPSSELLKKSYLDRLPKPWEEWGKDFLRIILTPFILTGMFFAALYGFFSPYDGRKLYASLERFVYGDTLDRFLPPDVFGDVGTRNSFLVPEFQPKY